MKKPILSLIFSLLLLLMNSTIAQTQGFLHTDGTRIVDEEGEEIIFRGIGLGGWMLQEGYMLGTSGAQHELEARIEALVGSAQKEEFYDTWLANHTRKIDIDSMAAWGFNLVRLPMHYKLFTLPIEEEPVPGEITWIDKGFQMTDQLLAWCKDNNIYLILDLHAAPGGQGENADISDYDPTKPSLWESQANRTKMIALWRRLAERYADEPMIAAYDLINEPNWGFQNHNSDPNGCAESQNTLLWQLQKDVTAAIREVDSNHMVIIEGNCWGNNYNGLPALWDDNLVISYHKYWNPNDQGAIQGMLNMRENRQVPIWLGETGENSNTWFTNAIDLFERNGIGWSWWPLKKLGYNNPLEINRNPAYQAILDHWNSGGPQPSSEDAFDGLMQLAEDLKLENNRFHPSVVDAMIRQPHSEEAIPFKLHPITSGDTSVIYPTDFDMGRHGIAYSDKEVENTTGNAGGQAWNLGFAYRNDGVDIEASEDEMSNGYNVGWTEDGEWLQFTVQVEEAGHYDLQIRTASISTTGKLLMTANGIPISQIVSLPNTGGYQNWQTTTIENVPLNTGTNRIRLEIITGGFNLSYLAFNGPENITGEQPLLLDAGGIHGENTIDFTFNDSFQEIPAGSEFKLTYDGIEVAVTDAYLKDGMDRIITLEAESPLVYGTEVLLSYLDTSIQTTNGTVLNTFLDEEVRIVLSDGFLPLTIPGRVETEDFAYNSGFEFEETTDTGGGTNAGYTDTGDYLDFLVFVEQEGTYRVDFRFASESAGGAMRLQLVEAGNTTDLTSVSFNATGGWQDWITVSRELQLPAGLQTIRLLSDASLFNINWLHFSFLPDGPTSVEEPIEALVKIFPNPVADTIYLSFPNQSQALSEVSVFNIEGIRQFSLRLEGSQLTIPVRNQLSKGQYLLVFEVDGQQVSKSFMVQ